MGLFGSLFGMGARGRDRAYGGGLRRRLRPARPYGAYPGCGCSSFFIIAAGILLVFGGLLRSCNM